MPKLTDTQLIILSAASERKDGTLLPLPKSLTLDKAALTTVCNGLLKQGLISERSAARGEEHWREEDGQRLALGITENGLLAIRAGPNESHASEAVPAISEGKKAKRKATATKAKRKPETKRAPAARGTKQALLIDLLKRKTGASIDEAIKATGWQAHSIRGAISGTLKRKLCLTISSEKHKGGPRRYRVVSTGA